MTALPELFMFHLSHNNDRARWALDHMRVPHRRRALVPGLHIPTAIRVSGQRKTPVLKLPDRVLVGSGDILDWAEEVGAGPSLIPSSNGGRAREVARWFSEEVGPQVRRAFFFLVWNDLEYVSRLFAIDRSDAFRKRYQVLLFCLRPIFGVDMKINAKDAALGFERVEEAFAFVTAHAGQGGYLVGDRFSVADLTAASMLGPLVMPPEFPLTLPEPFPEALGERIAAYRESDGGKWVLDMYRRHRGQSAAVESTAPPT